MAVKAHELSTPEDEMNLRTRGQRAQEAPETDAPRNFKAELAALRERIAESEATREADKAPHCFDCFKRGWDSALRSLGG